MSYNRCTGICKFGKNTYSRRIRCRSNLGHIFREKNVRLMDREIRCISMLICGPGLINRCSDSLRDGRFGYRIPVGGGARFSAPVQADPGAHPASSTMGAGSLSRGYSGRGVAMTTDPYLDLHGLF